MSMKSDEQSSVGAEAKDKELVHDTKKDKYTFIDWDKVYSDEQFAELCDRLRDRPGLYGDQIVLIAEQDKYGKLVPRLGDNAVNDKIAGGFSVQLDYWNENLPDEEKVHLHGCRSSLRFNEERRCPDLSVSLVFPTGKQKDNSVLRPLRSPEFVTEICRHKCKNELLQKIRNSYLVEGTNTTVALLICWTLNGNDYFVEMEFHIRGRNEPVFGPMWGNWKANDIAELAAIIPGFAFDSHRIMKRLQNYGTSLKLICNRIKNID